MKKLPGLLTALCGVTWAMHGQIAHADTIQPPHHRLPPQSYFVMPKTTPLNLTSAIEVDPETWRKTQA